MQKIFNILIVTLIVVLTACAPKLVPVVSQSGTVEPESNIITKTKAGIDVSVQAGEWRYQPFSVNDYFTPFLFLIRNNTGEKVSIKYSNFVLFDEHGNQYEAVPPDGIEYMLVTRENSSDTFPNPPIVYRFEEAKPPYTFGYDVPAYPYLRRPMSNITLLALPETSIYPNSQIRGFVYFRKAVIYGNRLKLWVEFNGFADGFEFEKKK
ncbi:MAG: hypothetical protein HZA08_02695 [Nitrospirae bacterium]|nr:hypothetical protein [Nitrospirota bacterium]